MSSQQARLDRERRTIRAMVEIYCRAHHDTRGELCAGCRALHDYAMKRIEKCPFKVDKPTCAQCSVHCYKVDMREGVRQVMRFAGPRMMLVHPGLTFMHYWDEWTHRRRADRDPRSSCGAME